MANRELFKIPLPEVGRFSDPDDSKAVKELRASFVSLANYLEACRLSYAPDNVQSLSVEEAANALWMEVDGTLSISLNAELPNAGDDESAEEAGDFPNPNLLGKDDGGLAAIVLLTSATNKFLLEIGIRLAKRTPSKAPDYADLLENFAFTLGDTLLIRNFTKTFLLGRNKILSVADQD